MNAWAAYMRKEARENWLAHAIILTGIFLSTWQFAHNRSLWMDEASLSLNILSRGFAGLLLPLGGNQVAPILYLQLTKALSLLTPGLEYGLRALPLLAFWASLVLFYRTLRLLFKEDLAVIFVLSLFAFNPTMLYFSSEVKQYMTDVFVAVLFLYLSVRSYTKPGTRLLWLAGAGVVAVWLSHIAPLVLTGAGACLFLQTRREDEAWPRKTVLVGLSWLAGFSVYYGLFIHGHPTREFMVSFWRNEEVFLPANPFSWEFLIFVKQKAGLLGNLVFSRSFAVILGFWGLTAAGVFALLKQRKIALLFLLILPVLAHLVLSSLELYPFGRRFVLYQVPLLITACGYGASWLLLFVRKVRWFRFLQKGAFLIPLLMTLPLWGDFPRESQEIKRSIEFINVHAGKGHQLFLTSGSLSAYRYYSRTGLADPSGFARVIEVPWAWTNERAFEELMTSIEGPCWVLFSHDKREFEEYLLEQASKAGLAPVKTFRTTGSGAYLFML